MVFVQLILNCKTNRITRHRAEEGVRCYECNSGTPDAANPLCPADGNLDTELTTNATCVMGNCMAKQSRANPGIILRGCSIHVYVPADVDVPSEGCITIADEEVCYCSQPLCNNMPMTPIPMPPMPSNSNSDRMDDGSNGNNRMGKGGRSTNNSRTRGRGRNRIDRNGRRNNGKLGRTRSNSKRARGGNTKTRQDPLGSNARQNRSRTKSRNRSNKTTNNRNRTNIPTNNRNRSNKPTNNRNRSNRPTNNRNRSNRPTNNQKSDNLSRDMNDGKNPFSSNKKKSTNNSKVPKMKKTLKQPSDANSVTRIINRILGTGRQNRNPYGRPSGKNNKNV